MQNDEVKKIELEASAFIIRHSFTLTLLIIPPFVNPC